MSSPPTGSTKNVSFDDLGQSGSLHVHRSSMHSNITASTRELKEKIEYYEKSEREHLYNTIAALSADLEKQRMAREEAEDQAVAMAKRVKEERDKRLLTEATVNKLREEATKWSTQFDLAQCEIIKANEYVANLHRETDESSHRVLDARRHHQELNSDSLVREAREEGLRIGQERGYNEGYLKAIQSLPPIQPPRSQTEPQTRLAQTGAAESTARQTQRADTTIQLPNPLSMPNPALDSAELPSIFRNISSVNVSTLATTRVAGNIDAEQVHLEGAAYASGPPTASLRRVEPSDHPNTSLSPMLTTQGALLLSDVSTDNFTSSQNPNNVSRERGILSNLTARNLPVLTSGFEPNSAGPSVSFLPSNGSISEAPGLPFTYEPNGTYGSRSTLFTMPNPEVIASSLRSNTATQELPEPIREGADPTLRVSTGDLRFGWPESNPVSRISDSKESFRHAGHSSASVKKPKKKR